MVGRILMVWVVIVLGAGHVRALEGPSDAAYEAGKQALRVGDWAAALASFGDAFARARDDEERWRAELGLALGHELAGDLLLATIHYRRFLSASGRALLPAGSEWTPRRFDAAESVERLERVLVVTHGRLQVTSTPGATLVLTPEVPHVCVVTPCSVFLAPGRYEVVLSLEEHQASRRVIDVVAGERVVISAALVPNVSVREPIVAPPAAARGPTIAAIATLSGAGALLVTSAVFWGLAAGDQDALASLSGQPGSDEVLARYDATRDRLRKRETAAWATATTGIVALGFGVVLALLD